MAVANKDEDGARAKTGPCPGGRRAGLRSAVRGEEDWKVRTGGEKGRQKVGNARKRVEKRLGR